MKSAEDQRRLEMEATVRDLKSRVAELERTVAQLVTMLGGRREAK